jgi:hypothetical protein
MSRSARSLLISFGNRYMAYVIYDNIPAQRATSGILGSCTDMMSEGSLLLRSLRVQRSFLCHQLSYQFFGPVNRDLIAYRSLYFAIPLNILVDLYALFAHGKFRIRARSI